MPDATTPNPWAAAVARLPRTTPRAHRGRDLSGLDCVGLVLWVYRAAGHDLSALDLPYCAAAEKKRAQWGLLVSQLRRRFDPVDVFDLRDGDVVVFHNHLGVVCGGLVYHMGRTAVRATRLGTVRPAVSAAFRLKERV